MAEISPLRRGMIEDMTVRNLSPATQRSYIHKSSCSSISPFKKPSRNAAACGIETVVLYPGCGRERPSTFWWRVTP